MNQSGEIAEMLRSRSGTDRVGVLHLVDTLELAGAERTAVDFVNHLPQTRYRPAICSTRRTGPLERCLAGHVQVLHLNRRRTLDVAALRRLRSFIKQNGVRLVHAHGTTLVVARLIQMTMPDLAIVWHLHFGRWAAEDRRDWRWALASRGVDAAVTSNEELAAWVKRRFPIARDRVMHLRNMVPVSTSQSSSPLEAGCAGSRIVCVANIRGEKDHLTLVTAFASVVRQFPQAHLFLIGQVLDPAKGSELEQAISAKDLTASVSLLGVRADVPDILRQVDIGVLSSVTEGLPVALLEYGGAGLPVVATRVGQCSQVLDEGRAGILVEPRAPEALADALKTLLSSPGLRTELGQKLGQHVMRLYNPEVVMRQLCDLYETVLSRKAKAA
jgi:glycosyltransferase involved in cell wall biosynthesis